VMQSTICFSSWRRCGDHLPVFVVGAPWTKFTDLTAPAARGYGWRMGALTVAFDTVIVGTLALLWVVSSSTSSFQSKKAE